MRQEFFCRQIDFARPSNFRAERLLVCPQGILLPALQGCPNPSVPVKVAQLISSSCLLRPLCFTRLSVTGQLHGTPSDWVVVVPSASRRTVLLEHALLSTRFTHHRLPHTKHSSTTTMLKTAAAAASGLLLLCLLDQGSAFLLPSASPTYSRRATASSVVRMEGTKAKEALSWQESLELLISPTTTLAQRQVLFQVPGLRRLR